MKFMDLFSKLTGGNTQDTDTGGLQSFLSSIGINSQPKTSMPSQNNNMIGSSDQKSSVGDTLNGMASGDKIDFNEFIKQLTPQKRQRQSPFDMSSEDSSDFLATFGKNMMKNSSNNKQGYGIGALLGQSLGDTDTQQQVDYDKRQKSIMDVIGDATKGATDYRKFNYDKTKDTNDLDYRNRALTSDTDYKNRSLDETKRNNDMDNANSAAGRTIQREMMNQSKYGNITMGDDGKPYALDSKTGKFTPLDAPTTFNNIKKKNLPAVSLKEAEGAGKALDELLGGNLDVSSKQSLMNEYSQELQNNNNNAPAALQTIVEKYGIIDGKPTRGFENNGFMFGDEWKLKNGGIQQPVNKPAGGFSRQQILDEIKRRKLNGQ